MKIPGYNYYQIFPKVTDLEICPRPMSLYEPAEKVRFMSQILNKSAFTIKC